MENEIAEDSQVAPCIEVNQVVQAPGHALGLQDLYKAALDQAPVSNFCFVPSKAAIISTNLIEGPAVVGIDTNPDGTYQLQGLKGVEYSADFVKTEEPTLDFNVVSAGETKVIDGEVISNTLLMQPYVTSQEPQNPVVDLNSGIQIHLVNADGSQTDAAAPVVNGTMLTYNIQNCEYTGDPQLLQKYLCDSAALANLSADPPVATDPLEKETDLAGKTISDSDSVGVNPETLGVRFEDCDFNSSDSFASTESIIPKNIKCPKCPKKFMFKSDLLRHDKYKHSVKRKFFCKFCREEFLSQQNLLFHEKSHQKNEKAYKCQSCTKGFKKLSVLHQHMLKAHSHDPLTCVFCSKVFPSRTSLSDHYRKVHMPKTKVSFKCDICLETFDDRRAHRSHMKVHKDGTSFFCTVCNKPFHKIGNLRNHLKSHKEDGHPMKEFSCFTCGKDCKTASWLEEHSRKHTGEKPFKCNICMKTFTYKSSYNFHIKNHAGQVCNYCRRSFSTAKELAKHKICHTIEFPYQCSVCNQEFDQESDLVTHFDERGCTGIKSQGASTQTTEVMDGTTLVEAPTDPNSVTLQNVNLIVDQSLTGQQSILLTSIGGSILTNSVPVILTQSPNEFYPAFSIT